MKTQKIAIKTASVLWAIWGIFHLLMGVMLVLFVQSEHPTGQLSHLPEAFNIEMMGMESPFAVPGTFKQHAFNLAWIGLIVTIASIYVWKYRRIALFTCILIGGFADLGYFLFIDMAGFAQSPGPEMTYIMALAIVLGLYAYLKSDKFEALK